MTAATRKVVTVPIQPSAFASPNLLDMTLEDAYTTMHLKRKSDREGGIIWDTALPVFYKVSVLGYTEIVQRFIRDLGTSVADFTVCLSDKSLTEFLALPYIKNIRGNYDVVSLRAIEQNEFERPFSLGPQRLRLIKCVSVRGRIHQTAAANAGFVALSAETGIALPSISLLGMLLVLRKSVESSGILAKVVAQTIDPEIDNLMEWLQFRAEDLQRRAEKLKL